MLAVSVKTTVLALLPPLALNTAVSEPPGPKAGDVGPE
jgi:hypothetical protein